ncbi:hypothetical protein GGR57DRAFT_142329 [Xylariaceae sp. FL1272]|nr:hypothetical protein GGR57DRAFT_142329 [Xylariaceae sp. FL1272]
MPPRPCCHAPSAARLLVQLYARRGASSLAGAQSSATTSILDVLLPPRAQLRALQGGASSSRTFASHIGTSPRTSVHTCNASSAAVAGKQTFSTSPLLARTQAVHNPQKDEDGNEMAMEITPRAATRLSQIMAKDSNPYLALRIQVESGGCHGFQYLMSLTTLPTTIPSSLSPVPEEIAPSTTTAATPSPPTLTEDDVIFVFSPDSEAASSDGAADMLTQPKIILDTPSLELLKGSKVDFTMELIGSQFKIVDNPLATSNCGCGTSFDIKM